MTTNPIFYSVDTTDMKKALYHGSILHEYIYGFKLGLEFFLAHGESGYKRMAGFGKPIFLDLKLHDISNTTMKAIESVLPLKPDFLSVHVSVGIHTLKRIMYNLNKLSARPKILGVTVLTNLETLDLLEIGVEEGVKRNVFRLAKISQEEGLDGVICSPQEVAALRTAVPKDFTLMVPGIRPHWAMVNDQKRTMTPAEAIKSGATYLVIGRPIATADDPIEAVKRIIGEIEEVNIE